MDSEIKFNQDQLIHSFDYSSLGKENFCKKFKININEIDKFFNNDKTIKFITVFKIASALNIQIDNLIKNTTQSFLIKFF